MKHQMSIYNIFWKFHDTGYDREKLIDENITVYEGIVKNYFHIKLKSLIHKIKQTVSRFIMSHIYAITVLIDINSNMSIR